METVLRYLVSAAAILLTFSVVVFVHELGHLITALRAGVEVSAFSLGFGKEILGYTRKGIRYKISAIPLGGYVKMKGEDPTEEGARDKDALMGLSPFRRIGVLASGAGMNFLTGAVIFSALIFFTGLVEIRNEPRIGEVIENSAAMEAGIKEGDRVLEIDSEPVETWHQLTEMIQEKGENPINLKIQRNDSIENVTVTPEYDPSADRSLIGITASFVTVKAGPFESIVQGFSFTGVLTWKILHSVYLMITGQMEAEVAGPIGIGRHVSEAARHGLDRFLRIIALISVNLGLINLFPIPVLDGGHIMFALAEKIKGKPLKNETIQLANLIGLFIIISLMLYVFWIDIFGAP